MRKTVLAVALLANGAAAFAPASPSLSLRAKPARSACSATAALSMSAVTRRDSLSTMASAAAALFTQISSADAAGLAMGYGVSEQDANAQLLSYGLPPMEKVPSGFKPLIMPVGGTIGANIDGSKVIESIGSSLTKGGLSTGEKVLLNFVYPSAWIVSVPKADGNGESGTVSANNYVKGDSAVVSALPLAADQQIEAQDKVYFQSLMTQSVPDNQWQSFKLLKKTNVPTNQWQSFKLNKKTKAEDQGGQEVVDIEYRYDLITSGPVVGRHGYARIVHTGGSAVALGATTSDTRFKGMKDALVVSAKSFRSNKVKATLSVDGRRPAASPPPQKAASPAVDEEEEEE